MTYPDPHYDENDDCQCPDHVAMRRDREEQEREQEDVTIPQRLLRAILERSADLASDRRDPQPPE